MLINGDWSIDKYERRLGDKLIIAPLPKVSTDGQYASPYISGRYLFFNVKLKGEHLKAAKMFAEYLVSPDVQELMIKEIGRLPSLKQVKLSEAYKSNKTMQKIDEAMVHGSPMPMNIEMRVIWDAIRPQLQNVMAGRTDAKKAMALMQKDAVRKIEEMKR
jgi:maltose-binding protein MalE